MALGKVVVDGGQFGAHFRMLCQHFFKKHERSRIVRHFQCAGDECAGCIGVPASPLECQRNVAVGVWPSGVNMLRQTAAAFALDELAQLVEGVAQIAVGVVEDIRGLRP